MQKMCNESISDSRTSLVLAVALFGALGAAPAPADTRPSAAGATCAADNGGIVLSSGFCASIFADQLGHTRHLTVAPNGVIYVNSWSGRYYNNDRPPAGGFLIA